MEKKLIKTWGVTIILFLAVFAGCLLTIFNPVKIITETPYSTTIQASLLETSKIWIEYPDYFLIVGFTGIASLLGAGWSVYMMNKAGKEV